MIALGSLGKISFEIKINLYINFIELTFFRYLIIF